MDLLIDMDGTATGVKGDLVFTNSKCPTTGAKEADVVAQRLFIHLRTFHGEWFMNKRMFTPWLKYLGSKNIPKSSIDLMLQDEIRKVEGVRDITQFSSSLDNPKRVYSCEFREIVRAHV